MFIWVKAVVSILCIIIIVYSVGKFCFCHNKNKRLVYVSAILAAGILIFYIEDMIIIQEMKVYDDISSANRILIQTDAGDPKEVSPDSIFDDKVDQFFAINWDEMTFLERETKYDEVGTVSFYCDERLIKTIEVIRLLDCTEEYQTRRIICLDDNYYAFTEESFLSMKYMYSFPDSFSKAIISEMMK